VVAGTVTGVLHTKFNIHGLLSGILVMTALYSVNLHIMGKSNVPLLSATTLATYAEQLGTGAIGGVTNFNVLGWEVGARDAAVLILSFVIIVLVGGVLYAFFRTNLGTAMRATGDNDQMIRALGVNVGNMIIMGLALANGLIALAGALLAQYQGFADAQMGIGMVVWGLASVIIGEALIGTQSLGLTIIGAVMGSILFRLLVAIALRAGLDPNDLKLITAIFVFVALILPNLLANLKKRPGAVSHA
jgi:putative ABC transport system permease protein